MSFFPSTPTPAAKSARCDYNISWMERTFGNRKNAESLLGPELENGNLTRGDYEKIITTVPNARFSDLTGFAITGACTLAYSRFKPPKISVGVVGYLAGELLGTGLRIWRHTSCFRSIENLNGFSRAMDNVKRKVGYSPGAMNLTRSLPTSYGEEIPFQQEADTPYGESPEAAAVAAPAVGAPAATAPQTPAKKSRWEEIRAARRADGPNKSWENIRQGRRPDGTPLPKQPASRSPSGQSSPSPFRDDDRAEAQASFDALLERERNMGSSK
ncbi:hypothetical protein DFH07DRAFT_527414 [Mycena maculata]|uniref:Uncharacterized protein n=1 Tax=Mycena maculata TaxID=230809 RepID=A0AAD7IVF6_9AGAR|nr:hypothetical protein DFH07DRAFT_527414 [Mycena maculata]